MTCKAHNLDSGKCTNAGCNYCRHEVKFGDLCAICGSITEEDIESPVEHIKVTHKDIGITVSKEEAKRLEKNDAKRLLQEKKLSLIVDLDQTILHAAWESNIANWVKERKENKSSTVKDIHQFTLDGSPNVYSIKLRPELSEFLQEMSRKYEMHIYTMGTRSYAEAVVKEIDPEKKLFADRILSRDENGNMTKKRLERLFYSDNSTVVVLDDRADVWNYTPNLIQIKPYEYFIGIGDINSPFAQPKKDIIPTAEELVLNATNVNNTDGDAINVNGTTTSTEEDNESSSRAEEEKEPVAKEDDIYSDAEDDGVKEKDTKDEQKKENIHSEVQSGDSKKVDNKDEDKKEDSKEEDKKDEEKKEDVHPEAENGDIKKESTVLSSESSLDLKNDTTTTPSNTTGNGTQPPSEPDTNDIQFKIPITTAESTITHPPTTHDTDDILRVIKKVLNDVHNIYFNDLLKRNVKPDVAIILNSLKSKVFKDVNVVFSGVIPLQQQANAEESWIWRMASSFGARCSHELTGKVTHLVAVNPGTTKVLTARKHGNIKIVSPTWITDSVWNWQRQDETKYFLPFAEISPAESEIENPEEAPLELDFDTWADGDEDLDDVLNEISSDDEEDDIDENNDEGIDNDEGGDNNEGSDNDDGETIDDMFLEDMDAILDSDISDDDDDYGSSSLGKRGRDYDDDDENEDDAEDDDEPSYKKQFL